MAGIERDQVIAAARAEGFELAGITPAAPCADADAYAAWVGAGYAGKMGYLADHRADIRRDPRHLLANARTMLCVGKVYNGPQPYSTSFSEAGRGWIARYAWGEDYHAVVRRGLERTAARLRAYADFEYRICVDTAPLLERSYGRLAGLGWIGRNTCLINQQLGSWVFLGEMLLSLDLAPDTPPPDRCGACRRCIAACPTEALVCRDGRWELDSRLCISYFTIELRAAIPESHRGMLGHHIFGCDICQDVCPWNRRAAVTVDPAFAARQGPPPLEDMAALSEAEFRAMFRDSAIERARYRGFLRNVAVAMGNSGLAKFRDPLERLAQSADAVIAEHALWALAELDRRAAPRMESEG